MFKKDKLLFRFQDPSRNKRQIAEELIKEIIVKATPASSCWWSKMKTRTDGFRTKVAAIKHQQVEWLTKGTIGLKDDGVTAKTCPGISDLLKTAYLIKCPTDVLITIHKDGRYYFNQADPSILNINHHPYEQYHQEDAQLFKNKLALKFEIQVKIKTTGFGYMLMDPTYHGSTECYVTPGIVSTKFAKNQELNIITLVDLPEHEETKTIMISAGDVLAYLIPFKRCSLAFSEEDFTISSFRRGFKHKGKWD